MLDDSGRQSKPPDLGPKALALGLGLPVDAVTVGYAKALLWFNLNIRPNVRLGLTVWGSASL